MPTTSRTFRIFVSSTFSDLKAERNALQEFVFPRLRDLATAHGCRFQAIDLRWGVSEEAGLDQQTMKICLGEIERCQKVSPRPNFIILLGDRYGWRPLPYAIPAKEFERLLPHLTPAERSLGCWREDESGWYRRDDNAVPPEYILQPRAKGTRYDDYSTWESEVERPLVAALERAAWQAGLAEDARVKYTHSATGQEIADGALKVEDAQGHVFGFFRSISNMDQVEKSVEGKGFIEPDLDLRQRQQDLKARLKQRLPGNIYEYQARWQDDRLSTDHIGSLPPTLADCLKLNDAGKEPTTLCEALWLRLSQVVLAEAGKLEAVDLLQREQDAHHEFGRERARLFVGRDDVLTRIADYLVGSDNHPLAVWGESGSGKSALMAKAVQQAQNNTQPAVILSRFIGATPESSNGRALLQSLCRQITRAYEGDEGAIPLEYRDLVAEFPKRLALATAKKPLVLFIDALDQLADGDNARSLVWLPAELPPHVRLVVSTLPGECQATLQRRLPAPSLMSVPALSKLSGERLLYCWLDEAQRTLTDEQQADILAKFERGGGLPLFLKLAFEEARHWHAYDGLLTHVDQTPGLREDIPGVIYDFFRRLEQESSHGQVLVSHALGFLAAAKNGLSESELLDVLWQDDEARNDFFRRSPKSPQDTAALPVVIWARLFLDLAPYLAFRKADGTELMTFYHRQVAEVVQEKYCSRSAKHSRHLALAGYFAGQKLWFDDDREVPNARKTSELAYQQACAGLSDDLVALLTHFDFLRAKLEATNPQALIEDFGLYLVPEANVVGARAESLSLIHRTLILSSFALARSKDLFAGQLFGRLGGFSQPEILRLLSSAIHWTERPWLRPIVPCLPPPGGALMRTLGEHNARWMSITPDGQRAISYAMIDGLKTWNLVDGTCERVFAGTHDAIVPCPGNHTVIYRASVWSETLKQHVLSVQVLDLETGACLHSLACRPMVKSLAITPDGTRALIASSEYNSVDWRLDVWDVKHEQLMWSFGVEAETVLISSNGRRGVSVEQPKLTAEELAIEAQQSSGSFATVHTILRIWDLDTGESIRVVKDELSSSPHVIITPDDRRLIYYLDNNIGLMVLDLNSGEDLYQLKGPDHSRVNRYSVTPGGGQTVAEIPISRNQRSIDAIRIWDLETGECVRVLEGISGILAIFPDGEKALDSQLRIWDLRSGECSGSLSPQPYIAEEICITPDGRQALTRSRQDRTIRMWNLQDAGTPATFEGHAGAVTSTAFLPGRCQVVSGSADGTIKLWDLRTGKNLGTLSGHGLSPNAISATPDERFLISGSADNTIRVWDLQSYRCMRTLFASWKGVHALGVTPDGQQILSDSDGEESRLRGAPELKLWNFKSEKPQTSFSEKPQNTFRVTHNGGEIVITPDGRLGLSASRQDVVLVDLRHQRILKTLPFPEGFQFAATPDGRHFVTLDDHTMTVWRLNPIKRLRTIEVQQVGIGTGPMVIVPDARHVAVVDFKHITVVDLETGDSVRISEKENPTTARHIGTTEDGKHLVVGDDDGLIELWELESGKQLAEFVGEGDLQIKPHCQYLHDMIIKDNTVFYGDNTGAVYFLSLENVTPGAPVLTAWRSRSLGSCVAFGCPHCRTWSEVPASALGTELPCPQCRKPVKLNPHDVVIEADWRPVAAAWRGEKLPTATTSQESVSGAVAGPVDGVCAGSATPPAQKPKNEARVDSPPASTRPADVPPPARRGTFATFAQKIKTALGKEPPHE